MSDVSHVSDKDGNVLNVLSLVTFPCVPSILICNVERVVREAT